MSVNMNLPFHPLWLIAYKSNALVKDWLNILSWQADALWLKPDSTVPDQPSEMNLISAAIMSLSVEWQITKCQLSFITVTELLCECFMLQ